jgi:hypothetical protein
VFDWLRRNFSRQKIPEYSAVRERPNRGLPSDLTEQEAGQAYSDRRDAIERSLLEFPRRPEAESPLFVEILAAKQQGLLTITLPEDSSQCLLIFSTPFRAADYVRTLLDSDASLNYLSSSPRELATMLQDLRKLGIEQFALDRCPRCNIFNAIHCVSVTTSDDAITCWSIYKAIELARLNLYLTHAQVSARAGELDIAREVLLETAAHVSFEDPRVHVLLGQVAVVLHDRELLREAKAFLQFFRLDSWERRLDEIVQSGSPNFDFEV